jgi:four helix bundle protein
MSRDSILRRKSFDFAVRIIKFSKYLKKSHAEYDLAKQILRSGTSVGAMFREAEHAESRKDFIHKLTMGLKEANESIYWLELLYAADLITKRMFDSLIKDATEILKILISSIKTLKASKG